MIQLKIQSVLTRAFSPGWVIYNSHIKSCTSTSKQAGTDDSDDEKDDFSGFRELSSLPFAIVLCVVCSMCAIKDYFLLNFKSSLVVAIICTGAFICLFLRMVLSRLLRKFTLGCVLLLFVSISVFALRQISLCKHEDGYVRSVKNSRYSTQVVFFAKDKQSFAVCYPRFGVKEGARVVYRDIKALDGTQPYERMLIRDGIAYRARCTLSIGGKQRIFAIFRNALEKRIDRVFENSDCAAFIKAVLIAEKNDIPKDKMLSFRRAGLLHLLAASGMHVGIVTACIILCAGTVIRDTQKLYLLSSFVLVFYLVLTGFPVSLLRACLMFWIITFCKIIRIKTVPVNSLLLAALVILILSPSQLYNAGFQLSFLATGGILLLYKPFRSRIPPLPLKMHDIIAITMSAQLPVVPLIYFIFKENNAAALLTAVSALPIASVLINLSIPAIAVSYISPVLGTLFAKLCLILYAVFELCVSCIASLPLHIRSASLLPITAFFVTCCGIFLKKKRLALISFLIYPLVMSFLIQTYFNNTKLHKNVSMVGSTMHIKGTFDGDDVAGIERDYINSAPRKIVLTIDRSSPVAAYSYTMLCKRLPLSCVVVNDSLGQKKYSYLRKICKNEGVVIVDAGSVYAHDDMDEFDKKQPDRVGNYIEEMKKILEF